MLSYLVLLNNLKNQFEFTRSKITLKRGSFRVLARVSQDSQKNVSDPKSYLKFWAVLQEKLQSMDRKRIENLFSVPKTPSVALRNGRLLSIACHHHKRVSGSFSITM